MEKQKSEMSSKSNPEKSRVQANAPMKTTEEKRYEEKMVRLMSEDIEGGMKVYPALTKITGVSWSIANATCSVLKIDKNRKIGSLTDEELKQITAFIKNPAVLPAFLFNRNRDFETGANIHLSGTGLELQKEFDIKRLKKIKSYRGIRHAAGQPVRGQRTKAHFRKNKTKGMGVKKRGKTEEKTEKKEYVK